MTNEKDDNVLLETGTILGGGATVGILVLGVFTSNLDQVLKYFTVLFILFCAYVTFSEIRIKSLKKSISGLETELSNVSNKNKL